MGGKVAYHAGCHWPKAEDGKMMMVHEKYLHLCLQEEQRLKCTVKDILYQSVSSLSLSNQHTYILLIINNVSRISWYVTIKCFSRQSLAIDFGMMSAGIPRSTVPRVCQKLSGKNGISSPKNSPIHCTVPLSSSDWLRKSMKNCVELEALRIQMFFFPYCNPQSMNRWKYWNVLKYDHNILDQTSKRYQLFLFPCLLLVSFATCLPLATCLPCSILKFEVPPLHFY